MNLLFFIFGGVTGVLFSLFFVRKKLYQAPILTSELAHLRARYESEIQVLKASIDSQKEQFKELQISSQSHFELLAQKVLEQKTRDFSQQSQSQVSQLLAPFREQIGQFEKVLLDKFHNETQERYMLKGEIERLVQMHDKMAAEAGALSRALRGDNKFQGDWGELVLERILESSGLREGEEYLTQASFQNEQGERVRPDVVIKLPENRHIVIDSKVSLKSFEAYQNCEDETLKVTLLQDHLRSIETHVNSLKQKGYEKLPNLESPDFVFLFIPIEPAWLWALQAKPDLGAWAWERGIAIVTASTLFTSLRTVSNLWRFDRQNKNAVQIAKEAGALYDKFVGFIEDYDRMGVQMTQLQSLYSNAKGRLTSGRGNLVTRIENLKTLGAKASKQIKGDWAQTDGGSVVPDLDTSGGANEIVDHSPLVSQED